jgi:hypothetical protein
VSEIQDLNKVAYQLGRVPEWEGRFRIVSALYYGKNCVLISSKAAGSEIELSGKANALQQLDLGAAFAGVQVTNRKDIGLEYIGKKGVIGLAMFKLGWFSPAKILSATEKIPIETSKDWHDLPDDL